MFIKMLFKCVNGVAAYYISREPIPKINYSVEKKVRVEEFTNNFAAFVMCVI